jgi:hypothetical protein
VYSADTLIKHPNQDLLVVQRPYLSEAVNVVEC